MPYVPPSSSIISLEMKPFSGGMPAMAPAATPAIRALIGMSRPSPPRRPTSRVPVS
jgi:hypothetical protein